jgi:hypothetical protein
MLGRIIFQVSRLGLVEIALEDLLSGLLQKQMKQKSKERNQNN